MSNLPPLGPRGEGWVVLQFVILGLLAVAGLLGRGAWGGPFAGIVSLLGLTLLSGGALLVGRGLLAASLLTLSLAIVLAAFFDLKSRREEAWLRQRYPGHATYMTRTRRLIPWRY